MAAALIVVAVAFLVRNPEQKEGQTLAHIDRTLGEINTKIDKKPEKEVGKETPGTAGASDQADVKIRQRPMPSQAVIDELVERYKQAHPEFKPLPGHRSYLPEAAKKWINARLQERGFAKISPPRVEAPCPAAIDLTDAIDAHIGGVEFEWCKGNVIQATNSANTRVDTSKIRIKQPEKQK